MEVWNSSLEVSIDGHKTPKIDNSYSLLKEREKEKLSIPIEHNRSEKCSQCYLAVAVDS